MQIALDATRLHARPSGAKRRFEGIYSQLFKTYPEFEFVVFESIDNPARNWLPNAANVDFRRTFIEAGGGAKRHAQALLYWTTAQLRDTCDIFEWFNFPTFHVDAAGSLLTVHDARDISLKTGGTVNLLKNRLLRRAVAVADKIVTVSHAMKSELSQVFPRADISVIYNGIDADIFDSVDETGIAACKSKFGVADEFLFAIGHFESRKNYPALIDAISILHNRKRKYKLVIVGNDNGDLDTMLRLIAKHGLEDHVTLIGGASDWEVRCLYKMCSLFVFPSLYEGFGIPVLEAMAARCPMVLSDIPVFRELTSGKGAYFSPRDPESLAVAIESLLSSESRTSEMIRFGEKRVLDFSFEKIAGDYAALYRNIGSRT